MRQIIIPEDVSKTVRFPREMVQQIELSCKKEHLDFSKFVRRAVDLTFKLQNNDK